MAASTSRDSELRPRMDGFTSTLSQYSTALADMNNDLEELQVRKRTLQAVLEEKQKQTAKLSAQVDAQRVRERGLKEQENAALQRIKQLNEELNEAKQALEKTKARGEELRQMRLHRVSEFEAVMRELYSEFRSLRLLEKGETLSREEIAQELSQLEKDVAELEEERAALVADINSSTGLPMDYAVDTLQSILKEGNEYLEEVEKETIKLRDEEAALKQQLEPMQQEVDERVTQEDSHMAHQWV